MSFPDHVYLAAENNDVAALRTFFASGDRDPNVPQERTGWTLLEFAARGSLVMTGDETHAGDAALEAITFLIEKGADVNYREKHTPLVLAASFARKNRRSGFEAVRLLVEAGADVDAFAGTGAGAGLVPLLQAAIAGDTRLVKYFLRRGADLDAGLESRLSHPESTGEESIEYYLETMVRNPRGAFGRRNHGSILRMITDFRAAGGTVESFLWAPRKELCMLRLLCERGRATPHFGEIPRPLHVNYWSKRVVSEKERDFLERLFAWTPPYSTDKQRRTRSSKAAVRASRSPLPRDVFKLVLSFWGTGRDKWWSYDEEHSGYWSWLYDGYDG